MAACVAEDGSPGGEETSRVSSHSNNRLPAELLVEIATCIQDELSDLQGPTVMSQVCGSWRVAVVDAANLWKTITVVGRNTALLQRYMQRSKDVPVDVTVTKAKPSDLDVAAMSEIIADHAHHIHSLCIDDSLEMSGVGRYIMSGLTSPMPMLETLCCYSRVLPVLEPPTLLLEALPFHPTLNQFPRLQFISLRGLFVPWTSLRMFSHLRTLELQCSIARPASSTADFLDMLDACPFLVVLSLDHAAPNNSGTAPQRQVSTTIQTFAIKDTACNISNVLAHLLFPSYASLHLSIDYSLIPYEDELDFDAALPRDRAALRNHVGGVTIAQFFAEADQVTFRARSGTLPPCSSESSGSMWSGSGSEVLSMDHVNFDEEYTVDVGSIGFSGFLDLIGGAPLQCLDINGKDFHDFLPYNEWRDVLSLFPLLRRLRIATFYVATSLLEGLSCTNNPIPCLALEELEIHLQDDPPSRHPAYRRICWCLEIREMRGGARPLTLLSLHVNKASVTLDEDQLGIWVDNLEVVSL